MTIMRHNLATFQAQQKELRFYVIFYDTVIKSYTPKNRKLKNIHKSGINSLLEHTEGGLTVTI